MSAEGMAERLRDGKGKFAAPKRGRGRLPEITRKRVDELCMALRMGAPLETACDFIGISSRTPYYWTEKGNEVESLIDEEVIAGKFPVLTERDRLYLEFFQAARKAAAQFELRQLTIVNAGAGEVGPDGKMVAKDWRAAMALLYSRRPRKYAIPKDVPFREEGAFESDKEGSVEGPDGTDRVDFLQYVYEQQIEAAKGNGLDESGEAVKENPQDDNGGPPTADDLVG